MEAEALFPETKQTTQSPSTAKVIGSCTSTPRNFSRHGDESQGQLYLSTPEYIHIMYELMINDVIIMYHSMSIIFDQIE
jgi:hypothetical protein